MAELHVFEVSPSPRSEPEAHYPIEEVAFLDEFVAWIFDNETPAWDLEIGRMARFTHGHKPA